LRCPGCCGPEFFNKHPSCSFITCCVKRNDLEVCAECDEKSFYCIAATLLPITDLEIALKDSEQKLKEDKIGLDDAKTKSKILKGVLNDFAARDGIVLNLRKGL